MIGELAQNVDSLIDFLAAYDARKNPPVHDISQYKMELIRDSDVPPLPAVKLAPGADVWLSVLFVALPTRPLVPDHVAKWIGPAAGLSPITSPVVARPEEPSPEELDEINVVEAWIATVYASWAARYDQAAKEKRFYRRLFELRDVYSNDRDALELVWGFGRVRWKADGQLVDHPLLTIPAEITVDDADNSISVRPAGALLVEAMFLSDIEIHDRAGLNAIRQSIATIDEPADPWHAETLEDLARRLVRHISQDGVLAGEGDPIEGAPIADTSWVLYVRRRRPDYQGFLDQMRELYQNGSVPPDPLAAVVIQEPSRLNDGLEELAETAVRQAEPLLLPLATNEQQQRIVTEIQRRTGITVQGPPGTGKSHTIANIISHSVAYGRRVLVVAEKEQALRVLSDKIPPGIRDLTVSVLGADEEGRRRLESSIGKIQTKVSLIDPSEARSTIERFHRELDDIDSRIAATTDRMLQARAAETTVLQGTWAAGAELTPSAAANWVRTHAEALGYIDDPLPLSVGAVLSNGEFAELIGLLHAVGIERAASCAYTIPNISDLPTGAQLSSKFAELDARRSTLDTASPELDDWARVDAAGPDAVNAAAVAVEAEGHWVIKVAGSWLARVQSQLDDAQLGPEWPAFAAAVRSEREELRTVTRALEAHVVVIPDVIEPAFAEALREAQGRLAGHGKLGWFAGDSKKSLERCTVDGRIPSSAADVELCLHAVRRHDLRMRLRTRWTNRMMVVDGPQLEGPLPEVTVGHMLDDLEHALTTPLRWSRLRAQVEALGIAAPPAYADVDFLRLGQVVMAASARAPERELTARLAQLTSSLVEGAQGPDASPLWSSLADALMRKNTTDWDEARNLVADLASIAPQALTLRHFLARLASAAPIWVQRITTDIGATGDPSLLDQAWQWRQLDTWVRAIASTHNPAALQNNLEELSRRRARLIADLVSEQAWLRLSENLSDGHIQALNRYLQAVKRYGKTGGKFAARWLAEIRQALNDSKDAVPVWIMTTSPALSSFRPEAIPPFDLLIIDEASQIGLEGLPLFALAKRTIVVGDDKQTSPENVGANQLAFFSLMDEHLSAIPNYKTLFAMNNSLYDIAGLKFPNRVMLTEHFRSLPEIIAFSNRHIYDKAIIPLRDQPPSPGWKALGAVKATNGYKRGEVNEPEADAVVDLISRLVEDPSYDNSDFGVVSLLGNTQSKLIWDKLFDRLGPEVLRARNIRCGEAANFQGDERDVIVVSLVVGTDPANPGARIGAMTGLPAERRINVAASRARDQMWVVHSVDADRFPAGDLRADLIRHCQNPGLQAASLDKLEDACDSEFERLVVRRIVARGYKKVSVQHEVGRYRIDIVVEGPHSRLAVECDGERWHGPEKWHQDRARQQVLERAKWTFERIRGSAFFRDPDGALEPLWDRLDELGIPTGDDWIESVDRSTVLTVDTRADRHDASNRDDEPDDGTTDDGTIAGGVFDDVPRAAATVATPPPGDTVARQGDRADPFAQPPRRDEVFATRDVPAPPAAPVVTDALPTAALEPATVAVPATPPAQVPQFQPDAAPPARTSGQLADFAAWPARTLREVSLATQAEIIDGLVEIVAGEGPMHCLRAYQLYTRAAGGARVGKENRRTFNQAINRAVQTGRLAQIADNLPGQVDKTVYLPGTPAVVVRRLGTRSLAEVPRSELAALVSHLGMSPSSMRADMHRAVLNVLGLTRLTEGVATYLDECVSYRFEPSSRR